jgi:hypothetical protein
MRIYEFTTDDIVIDIEYHDYHSGQHDASVIATQHNTEIGRIDFSVYKEIPAIKYIDVKIKRNGLATKMIRFLQSKFPEEEIDFGMLTQDGSEFIKSLKFKEIHNTAYDFSEYDDILKKKNDIANTIRKYGIDPDSPDWDKIPPTQVDILANLFNEYSDAEYDLEKETDYQESHNIKRVKKIII